MKSTPGKAKSKRPSVAELHHLKKVTLRTIAYAAIHVRALLLLYFKLQASFQARLALSTMDQWGRYDGDFDMDEFYHGIIELFDDVDSDWTLETLAWWNQYFIFLFWCQRMQY